MTASPRPRRSELRAPGVVLTRPHIAELILDLVDYHESRDLGSLRLLEPSCGEGAFVIPAARRLVQSAQQRGIAAGTLTHCLQAWDLEPQHVFITRDKLTQTLVGLGISLSDAHKLAASWVCCGDVLLQPLSGPFDVVVGNPPYVRIEQLEKNLRAAYRARFSTLFDRADLYVAFVERGLSLLSTQGLLSFVCADRFTKNRYGAPLRRLISERFSMRTYIDLASASPFVGSVTAYPSIFVIGGKTKAPPDPVTVVTLADASEAECAQLRQQMLQSEPARNDPGSSLHIERLPVWFSGDAPWILLDHRKRDLLAQLEQTMPQLGDLPSVRVGIGVATGLDDVFVVSESQAKRLEPDRVVPLLLRNDVQNGQLAFGGHYVISTFEPSGKPITLEDHPRLSAYLCAHKARLCERHIAKQGRTWFRTIDRVFPELVRTPKLLIPDIARSIEVTYDAGQYYPHHNLYFVTGNGIDLEVLGALLRSSVAQFVLAAYSVQMRGGYRRMQAQYLRKIRVPAPGSLPMALQDELRLGFRQRDQAKVDALARLAYGLSDLPQLL